jgi:hypothetical protein
VGKFVGKNSLQSSVNRIALQRYNPEHAFVYSAQGFPLDPQGRSHLPNCYKLVCLGVSMKVLTVVGVLLAHACSLIAQSKPPVLMPGLGQHHHTISTKNTEAQRFFDQGLTLVFAFNHEEAARSFRRASELAPESAMAFWGIALALGPCINLDVDPPHERAAYEAVQKALTLAPSASEKERDYIHALAMRYSSDPNVDLRKLDAEYASVSENSPSVTRMTSTLPRSTQKA